MKNAVRCLLLLVLCWSGRVAAQNAPAFAFAVRGGLLWGGGYDQDLKYSLGEGEPKIVWRGAASQVVQTARHVIIATPEGLAVLDPATWQETNQQVGEAAIVALAAAPDQALAFTSDRRVWRWKGAGNWTAQASGLGEFDSVAALAFGKGVWIAVGSDRWGERTDSNGDEIEPPATWYATSRIWWSADGLEWHAVVLPGQDDGGTMRLDKLAGGAAGFLTISEGGEVFTSVDGKIWSPGRLPDGLAGGDLALSFMGRAFWLLEKDPAGLSTSLHRTTDGQYWEARPVAPGASLATLLLKEGQVQAFGRRKAGRDYEVATVEDFAQEPPPNAAELAALKAAEEKSRADTEAKLVAEKKTAEEKAAAERTAAEAKVLVERRAREAQVAPVVAALEKFDTAVHAAASPAGLAAPATELLKVLDTLPDKRLADAVCESALRFLTNRGGAQGYFDFSMAVSNERLPVVLKWSKQYLTVAQTKLINGLATKVHANPALAVDTRAWPAGVRGARSPASKSDWDATVIRTRLAEGRFGAAADLLLLYSEGNTLPMDKDLQDFWATVAKELVPEYEGTKDPVEVARVMRQVGSGYFALSEFVRRAKANSNDLSDDMLALIRETHAGGYRPAAEMEKEFLALRSPAPAPSKPATVDTPASREAARREYLAFRRELQDAHRRLADLALRAATRTLTPEEKAADATTAAGLRSRLREMRAEEANAAVRWAKGHEGKMRESLGQLAALLSLALDPFKKLESLHSTYAPGLADPRQTGQPPYAHILYGRRLQEYAATLPAEGRREKLKAWVAQFPPPAAEPGAITSFYEVSSFSQFKLNGQSFHGLDLTDAWLPWLGFEGDMFEDRAEMLARQGRRDEALLAFDLAHALQPGRDGAFPFEDTLGTTDAALWRVPEEPAQSMQILMLKVSTSEAQTNPDNVMDAEAAIRNLGRRLELAARLPAARRELALKQVLEVLNKNDDNYVPHGLPDRFNPVLEQFRAARTPEAFQQVLAALPLEGAGMPLYWQVRATAASHLEPEATEGFIAVVAALNPKAEWLGLPADLVRERAKINLRRMQEPATSVRSAVKPEEPRRGGGKR